MSFNPIVAKSVFDCLSFLKDEKKNALDLGSQTCGIGNKFLDSLININKTASEKIKSNFLELQKKKFSTKDYFLAIGYNNYQSIDINGAYDSYEFDLNEDIKKTYSFDRQYELVINNGTGEHVFNQANLYLNFHNLTKKNGLMLNIVPFIDWINHGFYNYNPIFFADLAASNKYEILKLTLANRDGAELVFPHEKLNIFYEQIKRNRNDAEFRKVINIAKRDLGECILLVVISKKLSDEKFKMPLQGKYLSDVKEKKTNYSLQKTGSAQALGQIPDEAKRKSK
jgi:hypothetical protein